MKRRSSEPDRHAGAPDKTPHRKQPVVDDDHFGIDLGPAGDRVPSPDPDETASVRPPARTLTERLASAAADREDAANAIAENRPSNE